ncbi:hypothetical protein [Bartonella sp. HY038]|uniref:hypothetical protein n=1 Tax=Bartonella sp. HY038 TaxID=2759660 RepID=UPI0015FDF214|nr:hypothetical protein [Bartonella sp. HY038]
MAKLFTIRKRLLNANTGEPLLKTPYFIKISDGTSHFGHTDEKGLTAPILRENEVQVEIFICDDAMRMNEE